MNLFKELSTEEKYIVRLKVATRKYEVINNYVKIIINAKEEKEVIIKEEDKSDYCSGEFSVWEPIHKNIEMQLQNTKKGCFIKTLEQYKNNGGTLGSEIEDKLFFKLYHLEKPAEVERDDVGRTWIDYGEQLSKGDNVFDIQNLFGIWATNWEFMYEAMKATGRYGCNIMVLSPINTLEYIVSEKEIVGDGFNVRMHGTLSDEQTWYKLWELLGDKVFDEMPFRIREEFDGAKEAYIKYLDCKRNNQVEIENDSVIIKKKTIIDRIKSILGKNK